MCALLFWCSFKFSVSISRVTWNVSVLNHCCETREEKINDQLWDYSVINCIPLISELSTVHYWKWNYWLICLDLFTHAFSLWTGSPRAQNSRCLCGSLARTSSRINQWGIFVPSIAYHWYFENESRIIPETLQHVHVRKTKVFRFWMDYS